jgi:hypothetical protein
MPISRRKLLALVAMRNDASSNWVALRREIGIG